MWFHIKDFCCWNKIWPKQSILNIVPYHTSCATTICSVIPAWQSWEMSLNNENFPRCTIWLVIEWLAFEEYQAILPSIKNPPWISHLSVTHCGSGHWGASGEPWRWGSGDLSPHWCSRSQDQGVLKAWARIAACVSPLSPPSKECESPKEDQEHKIKHFSL